MNTTDHANGFSRTPADLPPGMSASTAMPPLGGAMPVKTSEADSFEDPKVKARKDLDNALIAKAREIYINSTDYLNANVVNNWERNLMHFRNEHAPGTPYRRADWKRSRTFRPKTRANVKTQEASVAAAAFSTQDILDVQAQDASNEEQVISAQINKDLAQYRLENSVPWFLTVIGAFQDTKVYGVCISHQYWEYEQHAETIPAMDESGNPMMMEHPDTGEQVPGGTEQVTVTKDRPCVDLLAPENFRFDPMCDWRDPAGSSIYLIALFPTYVGDALALMEKSDPKTNQPQWRKYTREQIAATRKENQDNRTRRAREGFNRVDPTNYDKGDDYSVCWPHLNIVRMNGVDIAWWTMGTELILTDPMPLHQMYPHLRPGERPFVVGTSTVEAHRNYPAGDVEQAAPIQEEINAVANQRLDNVKLVLNKRYFVRRGSQIDLDALIRNVPGGGVMVNDPEKDVQVVPTPDVTGSSYQEQDRLSQDFDELVGGFSMGTIANSKPMNNTKGGMEEMSSSAGAVQDFSVKVFFETWMEPVLKQVVRLEQMYETDDIILAIAAKKGNYFQRFGKNHVTDSILAQDLTVRVNVGIGNTDPVKRIERLIVGIQNVSALPDMVTRVKSLKIADEIFGALGYKDSSRFYMNDEEFKKQFPNGAPDDPEIAIKKQELQLHDADNKARHKKEDNELELKREIAFAELALKEKLTLEQMYTKLGLEKAKLKTVRDSTALKEANRISEINMRRSLGGAS